MKRYTGQGPKQRGFILVVDVLWFAHLDAFQTLSFGILRWFHYIGMME